MLGIRRREFITLLGGTVAWPLAARAESAMRVIGFLNSASPVESTFIASFRAGLKEMGFVEGVNVAVEYRWAEGQYVRLPELANDLVRRPVALIVATGGTQSARAATAATATIPVLFISGGDPVRIGLAKSMNRPGGNATGVSVFSGVLVPKRVELLRELLPSGAPVAALLNPTALGAMNEARDVEAALTATGGPAILVRASSEVEFDQVVAAAVSQHARGLLISSDPFFTLHRARIVAAVARHALPAIYPWREFVEIGGLMSYGPSITEAYRKVGIYAGRILNGAKPGDLPVEESPRIETIINLRTVHALGLTLPRVMLARADEIIE